MFLHSASAEDREVVFYFLLFHERVSYQNRKCYRNRHLQTFTFKTALCGCTWHVWAQHIRKTGQWELKWPSKTQAKCLLFPSCSGQIGIGNVTGTSTSGPSFLKLFSRGVLDILEATYRKIGSVVVETGHRKPEQSDFLFLVFLQLFFFCFSLVLLWFVAWISAQSLGGWWRWCYPSCTGPRITEGKWISTAGIDGPAVVMAVSVVCCCYMEGGEGYG